MAYDDDDVSDDPENPDPSDMDQDDYTITVRCPHCRKFIDEEAEQCPRCGMYLTTDDKPGKSAFSIWVKIAIVLALVAILYGWVLTMH
jgi:RNA polymerase subunit RPABC4/transcription elongation factor Spt4